MQYGCWHWFVCDDTPAANQIEIWHDGDLDFAFIYLFYEWQKFYYSTAFVKRSLLKILDT